MASPKTRTALFIAVPALLLLLPVLVFAMDAAASGGEIPRNVTVGGIDVSGMSPEDAIAEIEAKTAQLGSEPAVFDVNGRTFELVPNDVGFTVGADAAVAAALEARDGGIGGWVDGFREPIDVPLELSLDTDALDAVLSDWEAEAVAKPARNGAIAIENGEVVVEEPQSGLAIDRAVALELMTGVILSEDRQPIELPVVEQTPAVTPEQMERAADRVRDLIDHQVVLLNQATGYSFIFSPEQIASAASVEIDPSLSPPVKIELDPAVIGAIVEPFRSEFEMPPVDATYDVDMTTETVFIVPGRNGTVFDPEAITEALLDAALTDDFGDFPMEFGAEPAVTTADLEAYGPLTKVSEFTTNHPCCANRVINIQLMADTVDGSIVWPGEEFSINETVGERTIAGGYKRDGAIIGGEVTCCDSPANVGGGVSQFGTTIYNAIFFGCYEDIEHQPHSLYISRYPEGREATLGYPHPDVRFRNDTAYPLIIKTAYTPTSITVKFFGNKEGRECTAEKSDRFNYTEPNVKYEPNPAIPPGEEHVVSKGSKGWSVTVTRVITYPDGTEKREPFTHHYRGKLRKIEVHPCMIPGADVACPIPVPSVVGANVAAAIDTLTAAGFTVGTSETAVTDPLQDGIVQSQSPAGFADEGSQIVIVVGVYTPPPDDGGGG